jgi:hypothetical protein
VGQAEGAAKSGVETNHRTGEPVPAPLVFEISAEDATKIVGQIQKATPKQKERKGGESAMQLRMTAMAIKHKAITYWHDQKGYDPEFWQVAVVDGGYSRGSEGQIRGKCALIEKPTVRIPALSQLDDRRTI